jgi:hypothetical protein
MPKKWIPPREYWRMPHADERAPSLWWAALVDGELTPETECVIATYLRKYARGRAVPKNFKQNLWRWLYYLTQPEQVSPRKKKYWTLPAYASANRLVERTFLKRFRELEKIAKELFPHRVPSDRVTERLSEETKQAIRNRVLDGMDIRAVASEFRIPPFRVGQLCREEKATAIANREKAMDEMEEAQSRHTTSPVEASLDPDLPY